MKRVLCIAVLAVGLMVLGCSHKGMGNGGPNNNPTDGSSSSTDGKSGNSADNSKTHKGDGSGTGTEGVNFVWQDVHFSYDDASLSDEARQICSATGGHLTKHSERVQVEGHCDERGSVEYNLALGERRAKSVKDYLVSYGIDADRVSTVSYGKEKPLDLGHDEEAWARNRRAHFAVQGSNP